jgi:triosephosphate isomerase
MSRKKIVAGNWKMNLDWVQAFDLVTSVKENSKDVVNVERIIFPPFPYLQMASVILNGETNFYVGAQNCSEHEKGAYTGDVSATMIQSAGSQYVLIGHSERRTYFSETNEQLVLKMDQALKNNLKIIFCFGEQLSERKSNKHFETVESQLREVLSHYPQTRTSELVLAYEPVWAIGTGETATPQQAQEMHAFIRKTVAGLFNDTVAQNMPVLYGGSCNAENAPVLFACKDVDGGLIGGASLKAAEFVKIMKSF